MRLGSLIVLAWLPFAAGQAAATCSEQELGALSLDNVTVTRVDHGFFEGDQRYAIRCGTLTAEAFHRKAGSRIALMIEMSSTGEVPAVPAQTAARLYRYPLKKLFASERQVPEYSVTVRNYTELGKRMVVAAQQSQGWDRVRGRPLSGSTSAFVKQLLNTEQLYPELSALARELGYRVRVSDVEEVRTCQRLPCGALVTFQFYR